MSPLTKNFEKRGTEHRLYADITTWDSILDTTLEPLNDHQCQQDTGYTIQSIPFTLSFTLPNDRLVNIDHRS